MNSHHEQLDPVSLILSPFINSSFDIIVHFQYKIITFKRHFLKMVNKKDMLGDNH